MAGRAAIQDAKELIRKHGAVVAIEALSEALADLGPEWQGDSGPAVGIQVVTGYAPFRADDWRGDVRGAR